MVGNLPLLTVKNTRLAGNFLALSGNHPGHDKI